MHNSSSFHRKGQVFVTGATGLIGSHLLHALVANNYAVRALYRTETQKMKVKKAFTFYQDQDLFNRIKWVGGDLLDPRSYLEDIRDTEIIFHCAGMVSFDPAQAPLMHKVNVEGTEILAQTAKSIGIRKFCFVSSSSALGKPLDGRSSIIDENTPWNFASDLSDYALSKYHAESKAWQAANATMDVLIVNPTIVLGPGDWDRSSAQLFRSIWRGMPFYGPGSTGFVDVRDVVKAMISLCESNVKNERFVLVGENKSYREIFNLISDHFNKRRPYIKMNGWMGELAWRSSNIISQITGNPPLISKTAILAAQKKYMFSNQKVKKHISIDFTPIEKSIEETCRFFLRNRLKEK